MSQQLFQNLLKINEENLKYIIPLRIDQEFGTDNVKRCSNGISYANLCIKNTETLLSARRGIRFEARNN